MAPLRVGFLGFDQANALDLVGPAEAFASAFRDNGKGKFERCYEVSIIGLTKRSFGAESGIVFQPTTTIGNAPKLDTLIIPGGCGLRRPEINRKVVDWILQHAKTTRRMPPFAPASTDWRRRDYSMDAGSRRTGALSRTWPGSFRN